MRHLGIALLVLAVGGLALRADHKPDPNVKVIKTDSGLQYQDLKEGKGDAVKKGDTVEVHYTGWLAKDGKKFDSSHDRKKTFEVKNVGSAKVIQGWNEGLIGIKEGGKRKLIIPAKLAYGSKGAGDVIPPDADIVFDIEVIKVSK
jgi:peptidylprolyl isomerase